MQYQYWALLCRRRRTKLPLALRFGHMGSTDMNIDLALAHSRTAAPWVPPPLRRERSANRAHLLRIWTLLTDGVAIPESPFHTKDMAPVHTGLAGAQHATP